MIIFEFQMGSDMRKDMWATEPWSPGKMSEPAAVPLAILSFFLLHPAHQRSRMYAEDAASPRLVVAGGSQDLLDVVILDFTQAYERMPVARQFSRLLLQFHRPLADFFGKVDSVDFAIGSKDHGPLDHIL